MKIYISHSRFFEFKKELYEPIRQSPLNDEHEIIFPHEFSEASFDSRELFKSCDLMIAEVSFASIGLGIELGWANSQNLPIIALHKSTTQISPSVSKVTNNIISYTDSPDLIQKLSVYLKKEAP